MKIKTIERIFDKKNWERTESILRDFLIKDPKNIRAIYMLANVYLQQGRLGLAVGSFDDLLKADPDNQMFYCNAIVANKLYGDLDRALELCEIAAQKFGDKWEENHMNKGDPTISANTLANWGAILTEYGEPEAAEDALNLALKYNPRHIDAQWNRALSQLVRKNWAEGFPGYEWGFKAGERQIRPYYNEYPDWDGKDPTGKKILVWGEQGLGDEIMFSQCLGDLNNAGAEIVFECHPRLDKIFKRAFPFARVVGSRKNQTPGLWDKEDVDGHVPLASLPLYYRKTDDDFLKRGYLKPSKHIGWWRKRLEGKVKIGLSWAGGPHRNARSRRSIGLEQFGRSVILPYADRDIEWISLQYGESTVEEIRAFNSVNDTKIKHFGHAIDDYSQTCDLAASCDLIISVITAIVHLGGALDVPVWCLTPLGAPWKFPRGDDKMVWHPSVKLYHQDKHYVWEPVLERVKTDLGEWLNERL